MIPYKNHTNKLFFKRHSKLVPLAKNEWLQQPVSNLTLYMLILKEYADLICHSARASQIVSEQGEKHFNSMRQHSALEHGHTAARGYH